MKNFDSAEMQTYRNDRFDVAVSLTKHPTFDGEIDLSITHNGYQWQAMSLAPHEAQKVIKALQDWFK